MNFHMNGTRPGVELRSDGTRAHSPRLAAMLADLEARASRPTAESRSGMPATEALREIGALR